VRRCGFLWEKKQKQTVAKWLRLGVWGAAVLRPYKVGGQRVDLGRVGTKPRDLGNDRGHRVATLDVLVLHFVHEVVAGADG
jgi:hypothetical protein